MKSSNHYWFNKLKFKFRTIIQIDHWVWWDHDGETDNGVQIRLFASDIKILKSITSELEFYFIMKQSIRPPRTKLSPYYHNEI